MAFSSQMRYTPSSRLEDFLRHVSIATEDF